MPAVLDRSELEASPLADLHAIADQLGLDGFRRLRKAELIDKILAEQSGEDREDADREEPSEAAPTRSSSRSRRGGRSRPAPVGASGGADAKDNGDSADAVSAGARYEDLPVDYPRERFALEASDPTLQAIEWLTPFGRGSRVLIVGGARAGKSETLRALLYAISAHDGVEASIIL